MARTKPGETAAVKILRDGDEQTLQAKVKELPGSEEFTRNGAPKGDDTGTLNGVTVADIDARARQGLRLPANLKGVVVTDVEAGSAAAEAGLRPGDVITEINRQPVRTAEEAIRMTEEPEDKTSLLRVWREGNSRYVVVDESENG